MDAAEIDDKRSRYAAAILSALNIGLGVYVVLFVFRIVYARLTFPGILQHQESTTIYLVYRMAESLGNLYQMPALDSESVIYNPAYYFYLWALHPLIGFQAAPIRIVSVVPFLLLCAVLIEIIGRKYMQVRRLGWTWAFVSLAIYPLFTWIDLARLEAMLLLSIVLLWYTLCLDDDWRPKYILVGLAVVFSFAIKQPGALFAAAPLALALTDRRYLISVAVAVGGIAAFAAGMVAWFGAPYIYWAFTLPASHPFRFMDASIHLRDLVGTTPVILFGPLLWLVRGIDFQSARGKLFAVGAITYVVSTLGAGKLGGWYTQYVILVFLSVIPAADLIRRGLRTQDRSSMRFCAVAFLVIGYSIVTIEACGDRRRVRPRQIDRDQHAALLEVVRSVPGETWVTTWSHIDLWAGHGVNAAIYFLDKHPSAIAETEHAIRTRRFSLILTSPERPMRFDAQIQANYLHCGSLPMRDFGARMFWPTEVWARSPEEREAVLRAFLSFDQKVATIASASTRFPRNSCKVMRIDAVMERTTVFDLSPTEKLQLVEDLWDDLSAQPDQVPMHDRQRQELARRKANLKNNPTSVATWEEIQDRIRGRYGA